MSGAGDTVTATAVPSPVASAAPGALGVLGRWVWKTRQLHPEHSTVLWDLERLNTSRETLLWRDPDASSSSSSTLMSPHASASGAGTGRLVAPFSPHASVIVAVKAGLYKLSLGFFASTPPSFTVLVNGEPAVSSAPCEPCIADSGGLEGEGLDHADEHGGDGGGSEGQGGGHSVSSTAYLAGAAIVHKHPAGSVAGLTFVQFLALPAKAEVSVLYLGDTRGQGFMELAKI